MNTNFPEHIFSVFSEKNGIYNYKIDAGKKICQDKSILFCGIVRDVELTLELNLQRINRTAQYFKDHHVFVYENDSSDRTRQILIDNKDNNLTFISENRSDKDYRANLDNGIDPYHKDRCQILAECRNKYIDYINTTSKIYDYICVIDLDVIGGWSYDGFFHGICTLNTDQNIGCVSSYGILSETTNSQTLEDTDPKNYLMNDTLACRPININGMIHMHRLPMFNFLNFNRGDDPFVVKSNFGGLAIYKSHVLKNKKYKSVYFNGCTDPDHVCLHSDIIKDGHQIIFDPSMIVSYSHHQYSKENHD